MAKKPALTEKERRYFKWEVIRRNVRYQEAYQEYLKDPETYWNTEVFVSPYDPKDRIEIDLRCRDISDKKELGRISDEIRAKYNISTVEILFKAEADWGITNGNRLYNPDLNIYYDPRSKDHPFAQECDPVKRMFVKTRPGHILLDVDLEAPDEDILESAKKHVRKAREEGEYKQLREQKVELYKRYLRIWDLWAERKPFPEIAEEIYGTQTAETIDRVKKGFYRAFELIYNQKYNRQAANAILEAISESKWELFETLGTLCENCSDKTCLKDHVLCPLAASLIPPEISSPSGISYDDGILSNYSYASEPESLLLKKEENQDWD